MTEHFTNDNLAEFFSQEFWYEIWLNKHCSELFIWFMFSLLFIFRPRSAVTLGSMKPQSVAGLKLRTSFGSTPWRVRREMAWPGRSCERPTTPHRTGPSSRGYLRSPGTALPSAALCCRPRPRRCTKPCTALKPRLSSPATGGSTSSAVATGSVKRSWLGRFGLPTTKLLPAFRRSCVPIWTNTTFLTRPSTTPTRRLSTTACNPTSPLPSPTLPPRLRASSRAKIE